MCYRITLLLSFIVLLGISACKKKKNAAAQSYPSVTVVHGRHPDTWELMGTYAVYIPAEIIPNAWGAFIATEMTGAMKDTAGNIFSFSLAWQGANFTRLNSFDATVGSINVNNAPVVMYKGFYVHPDTTNTWHNNSQNHWEMLDNNNTTIVVADVPGSFPVFTGTLPDNISVNAALNYTFNASNCSNADSAQIILFSDGFIKESSIVNAHGGTAVIAQQRIAYMGNWSYYYMHRNFTGALFKVVLYNHTFQTYAGKRFAFVNQKEILKTVTLY